MRTGTHRSFLYTEIFIYIAIVTAIAISGGLVANTTFRLGNVFATNQQQTVNRNEKAERLSFPDQAYAVVRSQKADPPNTTFGMLARADIKVTSYHILDQVTINWTGPDGVAFPIIDNATPKTTAHEVEPAGVLETSGDSTMTAAQDEPAVVVPATAPAEISTNFAGEPTVSENGSEVLLDYPQRVVIGAGRWAQHLWGILFGDDPDS